MAENGNGNGIHLPRKLSFGAIAVGISLAAQLAAVVLWASNEHAERVHLRAQFDEYVVTNDKRIGAILGEAAVRNRGQDEYVKRLDEAMLNMLRRLDRVEERQIAGARTVDAFNEMQVRLESRLTAMESAIAASQEQQTRILKALDATYNLINEHLRVDHRGDTGLKNPDIWKGK